MEDNQPHQSTPPVPELTPAELAKNVTAKQRLFAEEYIKDFNATQAVIRAGHKGKSPRSIGSENLTKPNIRAYIEARLKELSLSAGETLKSISDIARANLADYFVVSKAVRSQKIRIPLAEYIERLEEDIDTAEYIHKIEASDGLLGEGEDLDKSIAEHQRAINRMKRNLIPHQVRLAKEPNATMIVDGPDELIEVADLDLAKLVKDKDAGRIKSFSNTEYGPKVEMYAADAALRDVGKYHKLFTEKMELTGKDGAALPPAQTTIHVVSIGVPFAGSEDAVKV